ncbi:NAD-P-binding protein [Mycena maculata]|uniref:NAD-P-binding protein n=1 Tax=Mycena maculata TaxID=230809 RepID=A0AAD7IBX6_9AGAR|nr:NAD-P-binding protein [Mycena maculata]
MPRIFLTGASGYIGGVLLTHILGLPSVEVYALVRTPEQTEKVTSLGAHPVQFDLNIDQEQIAKAVVGNAVTIVVHTADAMNFEPAQMFIQALAKVKQQTGQQVHLIHTSGAKLFSTHAGIPSENVINDTQDVDVYTVEKTFKSPHELRDRARCTNLSVIDLSESLDVRSYILVPPMVYGPGEGFGNKISIQFVAIVRIGAALQYLPQIPADDETWALCHLQDLISLYMVLLKSITANSNPPSGKQGYYFAENGIFSWKVLYGDIASRLASLGYLKGPHTEGQITLAKVTEEDIQRAGEVLGVPPAFVPVSVAGKCAIRGDNGRKLGWQPKFGVEHLMSVVAEEVNFIIKEDKLRPVDKFPLPLGTGSYIAPYQRAFGRRSHFCHFFLLDFLASLHLPL